MLVLSRKTDETIIIDGGIRVTVVSIRGNQVRLGIEAPGSVKIFREELCLSGRDAREQTQKGPRSLAAPSCRHVGQAVGAGQTAAEGGESDERSETPYRPHARAFHAAHTG